MNQKNNRQKKSVNGLFFKAAAVIVIAGLLLWAMTDRNEPVATDPAVPAQTAEVQDINLSLENGMQIEEVGGYTGVYMEDGEDEILSDILMIVVKNTGSSDIQYAEIEMPVGDQTASFILSTLPAGESMVVLEQNQMSYDAGASYTTAKAQNVAVFSQPLSLCQEKLEIQSLDGVLNVTNISGEDIDGNVFIYYKNCGADMLYGGITYRISITEGIKSGEVKQVVAAHFTASGSRIMFVTCG